MSFQEPSRFEYLLFDLGGVLIELTGVSKMLQWMNHQVDRAKLDEMWLFSPAVRSFETGKMTSVQFAQAMVREFDLAITPSEFLAEFLYFFKGFFPGAKELIQKLAVNYRIAILSNTNDLHWNRLTAEESIGEFFPLNFPSHKTGFMKPDREAYEYVIHELNCSPDRILFLDDNPLNVEAALKTGMKAIWTPGLEEVIHQLKVLEII
jgi:putative hydrolase of the HAD superfamily